MQGKLDEQDFELILSFAANNMNCTNTGKAMYMHYNSIRYRLESIQRKTGLDPRKFYDLVELVKMAKSDLNSCNGGETNGS